MRKEPCTSRRSALSGSILLKRLGDHSFSLALLDGKDTGVVITGLHTRERTRVYMKAIKAGKGEHELSEDEKKALAKALKS